ncbi:MAG TPA: hypothetical protein VHB79_34585 [Polyangiaceae bacterium]|nr:hypothetical protein [Polyangiaceae bacterium]
MLRRLAIAFGALLLGATGTWKVFVAEYFGRVDLESWAAEHPSPPAPRVEAGPHRVELVSTRRVVPSEGLDAKNQLQTANNNLDVVRHQGRVYLAWRSAPSHFASADVVMNVASSEDEKTWRYETSFKLGRDLREPRFLSLGDKLLLYVARLGDNPFDFEPQGLSVSERSPDGAWSKLEPTGPKGAIAWRVKPYQGEGLMVLYRGGENLYSFNGEPMTVELWRSADGRAWRPFSEHGAEVLSGGGSETDFVIDGASKTLFAVVRNEAGDASGAGSKLCRGNGETLGDWTCKTDVRKYDSPLIFEHDGEIYVVGRRNLSGDGRYAIATHSGSLGTIQNELAYITTAKRCSLWRWNQRDDHLAFVLDLPSRGDTCFPSQLDTSDPTHVVIYDYSSDINGPELPWSAGQRRETYVYRHELVFTRSEP